MEKISVLGLGYIGLPTASILANSGFDVLGIDINENIINKLNSGSVHIEEPELEKIFNKSFSKGKLKISKKLEKSDVFIITVPTPLNKYNEAELGFIKDAANEVSKYIKKGNLVILESTSPPGTTEDIVGDIIFKNTGLKAGKDYFLSFCPERVLPGKIIYELVHNHRIVGGINQESAERAKEVYDSFVKGQVYITDLKTAELTKLVENTFRDINIAFSNELCLICNDYGIDVWDVIKLANMHPRVNILSPGPGVGGHCIPIDPWFILQNSGRRDSIIEKARLINNGMPLMVSRRIIDIVEGIDDPRVTLFGASYKENIRDTRESPTIDIYDKLLGNKINVSVYDPLAENFKYNLSSLEESLKGSDILVLLVGHKNFRDIKLEYIAELMRNKNIMDTRNFYNRSKATKAGFRYYKI